MKNIIIGSVSENAGKTSFIVGLGKALNLKFSYLKPFGDRLIYRKKRLWDYDAALITNIFGLEQSSDELTIGFEHSKLRYMYDESSIRDKLQEMSRKLGNGNQILLVEGGKDLTYGASVRLDTLSLARYFEGRLIIIVSGDECTINDDISFIKKYVNMTGIDYEVVINKVTNLEDFKNTYLRDIQEMGIKVSGVVPLEPNLNQVMVSYIADKLQARVIAGESGLNQRIKNVVIGAMAGDTAARAPLWKKENKLVITGGDRSDMIVAALEKGTSAIVLTNNLIPPQNLLAKASDMNITVMLVPMDTFQTAKQIDDMVPLLSRDDTERIEILQKLIQQNIDLKTLV
jgi:uncharacterized protein